MPKPSTALSIDMTKVSTDVKAGRTLRQSERQRQSLSGGRTVGSYASTTPSTKKPSANGIASPASALSGSPSESMNSYGQSAWPKAWSWPEKIVPISVAATSFLLRAPSFLVMYPCDSSIAYVTMSAPPANSSDALRKNSAPSPSPSALLTGMAAAPDAATKKAGTVHLASTSSQSAGPSASSTNDGFLEELGPLLTGVSVASACGGSGASSSTRT
mmetsp:Transcript_46880/g.148734  ORF Transcript_46880/g.148734 Transcript_46880/m.148734 type:complete len:216 (+) Transcript_46880:460-1107(+)